jgi:hypothetical protein
MGWNGVGMGRMGPHGDTPTGLQDPSSWRPRSRRSCGCGCSLQWLWLWELLRVAGTAGCGPTAGQRKTQDATSRATGNIARLPLRTARGRARRPRGGGRRPRPAPALRGGEIGRYSPFPVALASCVFPQLARSPQYPVTVPATATRSSSHSHCGLQPQPQPQLRLDLGHQCTSTSCWGSLG